MFQSVMIERGHVPFPVFRAERHYMLPFLQSEGLPLEQRHWQPTVDAMLDGISTDKPIYFMVDSRYVKEGELHRRPGVHVDGYWIPDRYCHGGHSGSGGGVHRGSGRHMSGKHEHSHWSHVDFSEPEALILASNVAASRAYLGEYDGVIGDGGDCSDIPLDNLKPMDLMGHRAYVGTVGTLHQSLPLLRGACRQLVRLNCPGVVVH